MVTPLVTFLTSLLTQLLPIALPIVGLGLLFGGVAIAVGNHSRGKEAVLAALIGGAIILSSQTVATAVLAAVPH